MSLSLAFGGCAVAPPDEEPESDEPTDQNDDAVVSGTVADAVSASCSTASVKPLSQQIIDEMTCMAPDGLAPLPDRPNLVVASVVFPYLVKPARDALVKTLDAHPNTTM